MSTGTFKVTKDSDAIKFRKPHNTDPKKVISVDSIKNGQRVFVYNLVKADYNFDVPSTNGGSDLVRVEETWIPRELTAQVSAATLKNSNAFRRAVGQHPPKLEIVEEKEALDILNSVEGMRELERIRKHYLHNAVEYSGEEESQTNPIQATKDNLNPEISLRLKDILTNSDLNPEERHSELLNLNLQTPLTKAEVEFGLTVVDRDSPCSVMLEQLHQVLSSQPS